MSCGANRRKLPAVALAFAHNNLSLVIIPNTVTSIGEGACQANSLVSVSIPDSVRMIGKDAYRLDLLGSVSIGASVTSIDETALASTSSAR